MLSLGRAAASQQQQESSQPAPHAQPQSVTQIAAATQPQQGSAQSAEPQTAGIGDDFRMISLPKDHEMFWHKFECEMTSCRKCIASLWHKMNNKKTGVVGDSRRCKDACCCMWPTVVIGWPNRLFSGMQCHMNKSSADTENNVM